MEPREVTQDLGSIEYVYKLARGIEDQVQYLFAPVGLPLWPRVLLALSFRGALYSTTDGQYALAPETVAFVACNAEA